MASLRCYDETGVVALEFLVLFPLIIAMLYAAATYGIVFFAKYKMQGAVGTAVSAALYVDRSRYKSDAEGDTSSALKTAVEARAKAALVAAVSQLSLPGLQTENACDTKNINGVEMIQCTLTYTHEQVGKLVPIISFGWLGQFPPLPLNGLQVRASTAF